MKRYFVHNGYSGWAYGSPSNPQLVSAEDATILMQAADLSPDQVALIYPPAQYAETDTNLFHATNGNRFLFLGEIKECLDIDPERIKTPLEINWPAA